MERTIRNCQSGHVSLHNGNGSGMLKDMIVDMFRKPVDASSSRLVISSVALGMGVKLQHVKELFMQSHPQTLKLMFKKYEELEEQATPLMLPSIITMEMFV